MKSSNKFILGMMVVPLALVGIGVTFAGSVGAPIQFFSNTPALASEVNTNFLNHATAINDNDARLDAQDTAPAFSAYLTSLPAVLNAGDVLVCDAETLDEGGNGYNPAAGSYTVQRSGVYLLTFATCFETNGVVSIRKSGNVDLASVYEFNGANPPNDASASVTVVVRLNAGEIVWPEVTWGTAVDVWTTNNNGRYTTFSGCWIRP